MRYLIILLAVYLIQGCSSWATAYTAYTAYANASQPHIKCESKCDIKLPADIDAPLENVVKGAVAIVGIGGLTHVADGLIDKIDTGTVVVDGARTVTETVTNTHTEANVSEANVSEANVTEQNVTEQNVSEANVSEANVSEVATNTTTTNTNHEEANPTTTTTTTTNTTLTDSQNDNSDRSLDSSYTDQSIDYPISP
jgi:cytoskeletal protein RodZ